MNQSPSQSPQSESIQTVTPASKRINHIDSLRGLAVFGILLINIGYLAWPRSHNWPIYPVVFESTMDHVVDFCLRWFAKGKFYVVFSFLLGVGMAIQFERIKERGKNFSAFFTRRMFALIVIGLIHGILIWYGDILVSYALVSLFFLMFQFLPTRALWITALAIFAIQGLYDYIPRYQYLSGKIASDGVESLQKQYESNVDWVKGNFDDTLKIHMGSYVDVLKHNIDQVKSAVTGLPAWGSHLILSYLLGVWAWRRGILQNPSEHRNFLMRVAVIGMGLGLVVNFYSFYLYDQDVIGYQGMIAAFCWYSGKYILGYGYIATFLLLVEKGSIQKVLDMLQPVGQMALTNYIMHSVIFTLIFNGYGLGLMAKVGQTNSFLMVVAVCILQLYTSRWWLDRFKFGPVEWLWRSMTYMRLQPMKR